MATLQRHFNDSQSGTVALAKVALRGTLAKPVLSGIAPNGDILPVSRTIFFKKSGTKHECNARCMAGSCNGVCECACGGKNHGISAG